MLMAKGISHWSDHMIFKDTKGRIVDGKGWALFYWRLRYHLAPSCPLVLGLEERFSFNNEHEALDR